MTLRHGGFLFLAALIACFPMALHAGGGGLTSNWDQGYRSKARLIIGAVPRDDGGRQLVAGVEIALQPGWKTYWRAPGDAGGIPPHFDWSKSKNLKVVGVAYPAPQRFTDPTGTTIGYKRSVVFPVRIEAVDPDKRVGIAVVAEFGVCESLCIPARARLALEFDPKRVATLPPALATALARVPVRTPATATDRLPVVKDATVAAGPKPRIQFRISYPAGTKGADLFVETDGATYLPLARLAAPPIGSEAVFQIDLEGGMPVEKLRGLPVRLTIVSDAASAEVETTLK